MDETLLPAAGTVLAEKYEILQPLGKGGMGLVFEARHLGLRQRVAIKFLRPALMEEAECVGRFSREARAAARLGSAHVARIFDVDKTNRGVPYMVIEYLEGRDLAGELEARGTLPEDESVDWLLQACSGMAEAHAHGVIHRDLKPSNLFLTETGATRILKVLDFGVSKLLSDDDIHTTVVPMQVGTPLYMSPEQVMAISEVDPRSDIWSLGVILYRMISGSFPFNAASRAALQIAIATKPAVELLVVRPETPKELADAIMRALEKKPEDRFADVTEFANAIARFGSGQVAFLPAPSSGSLASQFGSVSSTRRLAANDTPVRTPVRTLARTPSNPDAATAIEELKFGDAGVKDTRVDAATKGLHAATDGNWSRREALQTLPRRRPKWVLPVALGAFACLGALVTVGVTRSPGGAHHGTQTAAVLPKEQVSEPAPRAAQTAEGLPPVPAVVPPNAPAEKPAKQGEVALKSGPQSKAAPSTARPAPPIPSGADPIPKSSAPPPRYHPPAQTSDPVHL